MDPISVVLIAIGLSMDAFAVSVCAGLQMDRVLLHLAARIAVFFGGFQMLMPVLGWLGGSTLQVYICSIDHWVAFGLLAIIGGKMLYEATRGEECQRIDPLNLALLLTLAVATSIDAFAVGLSFALLDISIRGPVLAIGAITFGLSLVGVYLGHRFGELFQTKVQALGGLILVGIGVRILVEHVGPTLLAAG